MRSGAEEALRRRATIVFCDLSGYTALNEALDPEEVEQIMSRIKDDAIRIVEGLGGTVNQFVGDEVMALFGIPIAHGDDPVRAVLAALRLHESLGPLAADVRARTGMTIALHTAVNTGLLLARRRDDREGRFTVTGDAVNTCARLLKLASLDEIVVGATTERLVASRFVLEALAPARVKGKAQPLASYRVTGERAAAHRSDARHFVGRERELSRLTALMRTTASRGAGATVLVRGEAGIGKSSLVRAARRAAEDAGRGCHAALALDFGVDRGQGAIAMLVASLLGVDASDTTAHRASAVDAAIARGLVSTEERVFVDDLLALPHSPADRALLEAMEDGARARAKIGAVTELAERTAKTKPIFVVVEDLHWADDFVIDALGSLARLSERAPILLVLTSRPEAGARVRDRIAGGAVDRVESIDLGPLGADEARTLAEQLRPARAEVFAECIARAGGHPLFLEQLLLNADFDDERVPATVEGIVLARMDRLPPGDREALQAASVLGQRFDNAALGWLVADGECDCESLVAANLLVEDGMGFTFAHALVQDAVYGALLLARRRELHRRAAEWYAKRHRGLAAEHLERAGDPSAAAAFLEAATAQFDELDARDAQRLIARGLALVTTGRARHDLLELDGRIHLDLGEREAAITSYVAALDAAETGADRCRAWLGLAGARRLADDHAEALAALDRAEEAARASALDEELGRILHLRGNIRFAAGDLDGCLEQHQAALACARRIGSTSLQASAEGGVGDAHYFRGDMSAAMDCFSRCIDLCRANGLVRIEVANSPMLGWLRAYSGEPALALSEGLAAAGLAHRVSHQRAEMVGRSLTGWVALELGELDGAEREIQRLDAIATALPSHRFMVQALVWSAYLAEARGDRDEAARRVERAAALRRDSDRSFHGAFVLGALARVGRDRAVGESALAEGEAFLATNAVAHNHLWFYRDAIEFALEWRDWDRAERFASAIEACTRTPLVWSEVVASRARALAALGRGRRDAATIDALRAARDRASALGYRAGLAALAHALE